MADWGSAIWPPDPISTARLVLRAPEGRDRTALVELFTSQEIATDIGGAKAREEIERAIPEIVERGPGLFVVELDGSLIGTVELHRRAPDYRRRIGQDGAHAELGYIFSRHSWGNGYATEACAAALDWYADAFPGASVVLYTQTTNNRSICLAERLGFAEVARFEESGVERWFGIWADPNF